MTIALVLCRYGGFYRFRARPLPRRRPKGHGAYHCLPKDSGRLHHPLKKACDV